MFGIFPEVTSLTLHGQVGRGCNGTQRAPPRAHVHAYITWPRSSDQQTAARLDNVTAGRKRGVELCPRDSGLGISLHVAREGHWVAFIHHLGPGRVHNRRGRDGLARLSLGPLAAPVPFGAWRSRRSLGPRRTRVALDTRWSCWPVFTAGSLLSSLPSASLDAQLLFGNALSDQAL